MNKIIIDERVELPYPIKTHIQLVKYLRLYQAIDAYLLSEVIKGENAPTK